MGKGWSWAQVGPISTGFSGTRGTEASPETSGNGNKDKKECGTNLAAHRLLVLLAALLSALVGLDAEAGPASGTGGLAAGAAGFLLVLEQLHQQVKLQTAGRLEALPRSCRNLLPLSRTTGSFWRDSDGTVGMMALGPGPAGGPVALSTMASQQGRAGSKRHEGSWKGNR